MCNAIQNLPNTSQSQFGCHGNTGKWHLAFGDSWVAIFFFHCSRSALLSDQLVYEQLEYYAIVTKTGLVSMMYLELAGGEKHKKRYRQRCNWNKKSRLHIKVLKKKKVTLCRNKCPLSKVNEIFNSRFDPNRILAFITTSSFFNMYNVSNENIFANSIGELKKKKKQHSPP